MIFFSWSNLVSTLFCRSRRKTETSKRSRPGTGYFGKGHKGVACTGTRNKSCIMVHHAVHKYWKYTGTPVICTMVKKDRQRQMPVTGYFGTGHLLVQNVFVLEHHSFIPWNGTGYSDTPYICTFIYLYSYIGVACIQQTMQGHYYGILEKIFGGHTFVS